ncbi:MAG: LysR family transcriptional regulator [Roseburia sp.]
MNTKQIHYFVEVTKRKSFTKASQELFICQSALSKAIKELEKDLGVQLIDRAAKGFRLTPEGKNMYEKAQICLRKIDDEMNSLYDSLHIERGEIRVGVPPVIGTAFFTHIMDVFAHKYSDIKVNISEAGANTIKTKVERGEVDIGVIILPFSAPGFEVMPVIQSKNVLLVNKNHRLAGCRDVAFLELEHEDFYSLDETFMLYDRTLQLCGQAGFVPKIIGKSSQWDFLAGMVAVDRGICILPGPIMKKYNSENICILQLKEPEFYWDIALLVRSDKYISNAIEKFIQVVREEGPKLV